MLMKKFINLITVTQRQKEKKEF